MPQHGEKRLLTDVRQAMQVARQSSEDFKDFVGSHLLVVFTGMWKIVQRGGHAQARRVHADADSDGLRHQQGC